MTPCCHDCKRPLTAKEASPRRLRLGERLCDPCWSKRLGNGTLAAYWKKLDEDRRLVDALIDKLVGDGLP